MPTYLQKGNKVMAMPLLIVGGRIVDPSQGINTAGNLLIIEGKIARLGENSAAPDSGHLAILDAAGLVVCPGFIDLHCHLREPGFEEKETIATGTRAAAKGGYTTICCMPNTNPPLDTKSTVEYVRSKAESEGMVRVLPIGCITKGRRGQELVEMGELAAAGVVAFSDDGEPVADSPLMRHALDCSLAFGMPIIAHCEDKTLSKGGLMNEGGVSARLGLKGIPAAAEETMIARDLTLAQLTGARVHIAHVSTEGSVELIRRAKEKGIRATAEVTPHHLTLTEESVIDVPYDTNAKVNPPLRTRRDQEALIRGLRDGLIDAIATDHAPHTLADKMCEFGAAAFGISGLETALGSLMTLVHSGELELVTLISKLTIEPARILDRGGQDIPFSFTSPVPWGIGTLQPGAPGDVTIIDPEAEWIVDPETFVSKGKNTPLEGSRLRGRVMATIVGGELVYQDDRIKVETR